MALMMKGVISTLNRGPTSFVKSLTHTDYIARGKCQGTHYSQFGWLWCFAKAGHDGDHWALDMQPRMKARKVYWSDEISSDEGQQEGQIK